MEDFEKIQRREGERQKLLDELKGIVVDAEEECLLRAETPEANVERIRKTFHWVLSTGLFSYLLFEDNFGPMNLPVNKEIMWIFSLDFASQKIMPKIKAFTRVEAEQLYLVGCLLEYSMSEIRHPFNQKILELSVPPGRDWFLKEISLGQVAEQLESD